MCFCYRLINSFLDGLAAHDARIDQIRFCWYPSHSVTAQGIHKKDLVQASFGVLLISLHRRRCALDEYHQISGKLSLCLHKDNINSPIINMNRYLRTYYILRARKPHSVEVFRFSITKIQSHNPCRRDTSGYGETSCSDRKLRSCQRSTSAFVRVRKLQESAIWNCYRIDRMAENAQATQR